MAACACRKGCPSGREIVDAADSRCPQRVPSGRAARHASRAGTRSPLSQPRLVRSVCPHAGQLSASNWECCWQANTHGSRHSSCQRPCELARHAGQNRDRPKGQVSFICRRATSTVPTTPSNRRHVNDSIVAVSTPVAAEMDLSSADLRCAVISNRRSQCFPDTRAGGRIALRNLPHLRSRHCASAANHDSSASPGSGVTASGSVRGPSRAPDISPAVGMDINPGEFRDPGLTNAHAFPSSRRQTPSMRRRCRRVARREAHGGRIPHQ